MESRVCVNLAKKVRHVSRGASAVGLPSALLLGTAYSDLAVFLLHLPSTAKHQPEIGGHEFLSGSAVFAYVVHSVASRHKTVHSSDIVVYYYLEDESGSLLCHAV